MLCYFKFHDLRSFAFRLVFLLSFSDFFNSIAGFFGDAGGNDETWLSAHTSLCYVQGIMFSYFGSCSLLWNASIAFTLHKAFLLGDEEYSAAHIGTKMNKYLAVCFGVPLILTLLPLTSGSYGDTGGWCGIIYSDWGIAWRYISFYILCWLVVGYNTYVYFCVWRRVREDARNGHNAEGQDKLLRRIKFYPLVLVLCWAFATIDIVYITLSGGDFVLWLQGLHIFFSTVQGFFNACVYGMTPTVRNKVRMACLGERDQVLTEESSRDDVEFTKFSDVAREGDDNDGGGI
jgi:hypothetical protein